MTDKEKHEALVAEIERQYEETSIGLNEHENGVEHGRMEVINALRTKIDFMHEDPEQQTVILYGLSGSVGTNEEPVSDDLEKEIDRWSKEQYYNESEKRSFAVVARHFAEWQKKQMMKEALDAEVRDVEDFMGTTTFRCICDKYKKGDKVQVIILKKE